MPRKKKSNKGKTLRGVTDADKSELASRVKALRMKKGWTQKEMSEAFGLSVGAIAQWELKTKFPSGAALKLLEIYEKLGL